MTDTLSDVLRAVRLEGAVFFTVEASDPWVADTPRACEVAPHLMPGVEHVIAYHVLTEGSCHGGLIGEPPFLMEAGDVLVFPQGDAHAMSSAPGMRGEPDTDVYLAASKGVPVALSIQGGGPGKVRIICGYLGCDARPFNPLLSALPRVIHVRGQSGADSILRRLVELAVVETGSPRSGSECALSRLSELLFVEIVRHYVASLPPDGTGWFAGLRDPHVGGALQKIHERPTHAWTLERLAREVGASRSVLAERFAHLVGIPPIQYLTQWRIQLAASLLRSSKASLAEVADRVGYGSEAALSRAFKRMVGVAPAHYRRSEDPAAAPERAVALAAAR